MLLPISHMLNTWINSFFSFFHYCQRLSKYPQDQRMDDRMPKYSPPVTRTVKKQGSKGEEEIELISDFSWRNFFSSINFVRIMQKLSKHRSHRIWLLVQYKSSVSIPAIISNPCPWLIIIIGSLEASNEGFTPDASTVCTKTYKKPSSLFRS